MRARFRRRRSESRERGPRRARNDRGGRAIFRGRSEKQTRASPPPPPGSLTFRASCPRPRPRADVSRATPPAPRCRVDAATAAAATRRRGSAIRVRRAARKRFFAVFRGRGRGVSVGVFADPITTLVRQRAARPRHSRGFPTRRWSAGTRIRAEIIAEHASRPRLGKPYDSRGHGSRCRGSVAAYIHLAVAVMRQYNSTNSSARWLTVLP